MDRTWIATFLKQNIAVRLACYPFMNLKRAMRLKRYADSRDRHAYELLKDIHKGKRCFIVGNGPSLTAGDLDLIQDELSFGVNGIFQIYDRTKWRPAYYCCCDKESWAKNYRYFERNKVPGTLLLESEFAHIPANQTVIRLCTQTRFSIRRHQDIWRRNARIAESAIPGVIHDVSTVTLIALQAAVHMGFGKVYFIGQDCSFKAKENHYPEGFRQNFYSPSIDSDQALMFQSFRVAKDYAEAHGVQIFNATRGGELEIFKRVSIDSLFEG